MTTYRLTPRGVVVLLVATVALLTVAGILATDDTHPARTFAPCVTEDAPGPCHWDADTRGNGHGISYVVTPDQALIYLGK
jgi:hypothetical protein